MPRTLSLPAITVLLGACAAVQPWWLRDLQAWQGAPVTELVEAWGPPLRTITAEHEATVLVYESARQLDHRLDRLQDPGARLGADRGEPAYLPADRSECTLYFEITDQQVTGVRHEGGACPIVPRDPRERRTDAAPRPAR